MLLGFYSNEFLLFSYRKGDLILLDRSQTGEDVMVNGYCRGENLNSKERGEVRGECVYILPSMHY